MKYCAHDYQAYATDFVLSHPYCGLILDMGLGKSVITLTALWDLLLDSFDVGCVLVVAPKRVAEDTWPREIAKWEHLKGLTYSLVMGSEKERRAALARKAMIYIINRENVSWLVEHTAWRFDALVIDELSSFKSAKAQRFKALKKVRPPVQPGDRADRHARAQYPDRSVAADVSAGYGTAPRTIPDPLPGALLYARQAEPGDCVLV